jgi:hypothetical protein
MQVSGLPMPNGPVGDPGWRREADQIAERYTAERAQFRSDLDRVIARSTNAAFIARLNVGARILQVPQFKGAAVGSHYLVKGPGAATCFAVKLFLNPQQPYGADLHRCQWDECLKFFLASDAYDAKKKESGRKRWPCAHEVLL